MPSSTGDFCYVPTCDLWNCQRPAAYKIAAIWTDGVLTELKPYGLACPDHVGELFREVRLRHERCKLAPGESLGPLRIYLLCPGRRDSQLEIATDVERQLGINSSAE